MSESEAFSPGHLPGDSPGDLPVSESSGRDLDYHPSNHYQELLYDLYYVRKEISDSQQSSTSAKSRSMSTNSSEQLDI